MTFAAPLDLLDTIAILISIAALLSYLNARFIRLPTTIGLMLIALLMSLALIGLDRFDIWNGQARAAAFLAGIDFNKTLLEGMLSFLLFAGALHVDLSELARHRWLIGVLATLGVLLSTAIVGVASWGLFGILGLEVPLMYCLLFGALISPTDPIAVLGVLRQVGVPASLQVKITGESLFNDGVGVVVFLTLAGITFSEANTDALSIATLFATEVFGGVLFGLAIGLAAYHMLKSIDNYQVEILLTLAVVAGGYAAARALHISGPIVMVVAGLLIGNHGRALAMSDDTVENLDRFWELIDEILNAVLFVLIGLEVLVLTLSAQYLLAGTITIAIVLAARFVSVGALVGILRLRQEFSPRVVRILTWGGLRGGISIALALSLPAGPQRDLILTITYVVVVFSILVQGLTIGPLVKDRNANATPDA